LDKNRRLCFSNLSVLLVEVCEQTSRNAFRLPQDRPSLYQTIASRSILCLPVGRFHQLQETDTLEAVFSSCT
jgi:hypothetical protein